ncbi:FAD-dependent oxidoreductase, partial [candidate division WOR-3 bacterium]|nr:FAD-dependent oxidoreductase [candidate division WOR-3 bacterium]
MYDICIIGSGSAGYVAGIRGAQLGKKVCVVERSEIGGVCLNLGCIPTKAILASVEILQSVKNAKKFGIKVGSPEPSFQEIMKRKDIIVKRLTSGVRFLLKQNGIEVITGEASIKGPGCLKVEEKEIRAKSIIICTGSSPFLPFKIDREYILTSDEALNLEHLPKSILIIGAGAIGVEFAT